MHAKCRALVYILCAALLLSACGEATVSGEELLSTQSLSADLDGDGYQELLVGWRATAELQVLEVYAQSRARARPAAGAA